MYSEWTGGTNNSVQTDAGLRGFGRGGVIGVPNTFGYVENLNDNDEVDAIFQETQGGSSGREAVHEYHGQINFASVGAHSFEINSTTTGPSELWIDGELVIQTHDPDTGVTTDTVTGTFTPSATGWTDIYIKAVFRDATEQTDVEWDPAGGSTFVDIPSTSLRVEAPVSMWHKAGDNSVYKVPNREDFTLNTLAVDGDALADAYETAWWLNSGPIENRLDNVDDSTTVTYETNIGFNGNPVVGTKVNNWSWQMEDPVLYDGTPTIAEDSDYNSIYRQWAKGLPLSDTARSMFAVGDDNDADSGTSAYIAFGDDGASQQSSQMSMLRLVNGEINFDAWGDNVGEANPGVLSNIDNAPFMMSFNKATGPGNAALYGFGNEVVSVGGYDIDTQLDEEDDATYAIGDLFNDTQYYLNGYVGEAIVFPYELSEAQLVRVDSYLAIKYGLTIDESDESGSDSIEKGDYHDSQGTVVWDGNEVGDDGGVTVGADNGYHNDVFGIGRDDVQGLDQRVSRSENFDGEGVVMIGTDSVARETEFATTQTATQAAADLDFTMIGNNNGNASGWVAEDVPAGYYRLGITGDKREWRVRETGTDATYAIAVDLEDAELNLPQVTSLSGTLFVAFDSDGDNDLTDEVLGTGVVAMYDNGTNGDVVSADNIYTVTGIDLDDGDEFTFVQEAPLSPGDVGTNLLGWWKADIGAWDATEINADDAEVVTSWRDQSGNENHGTAVGLQQTLDTDAINNQPAIDFPDGISDYFDTNLSINESSLPDLTVFAVARSDGNSNDQGVWGEDAGSNERFIHYDTALDGIVYSTTNTTAQTLGIIDVDVTYLTTTSFLEDSLPVDESRLFVNGLEVVQFTSNHGPDAGNTFNIGDQGDGTANAEFNGQIAEVIVYGGGSTGDATPAISDLQRQRVESYLAIKYGIHLDNADNDGGYQEGDYVLADGATVVWDGDLAGADVAYHNEVSGFAHDDLQALLTTTAKNEAPEGVVRIHTPSDLADQEALMFGNNNGTGTSWTATGAPTDGAGYQILSREWKMVETGDVGTVTFEVEMENTEPNGLDLPAITAPQNTLYLVLDPEGDGFSDATLAGGEIIAMYDNGTNGDVTASDQLYSIETVNVANDMFFTFAQDMPPTPGGIGTDLHAWWKADFGTFGDIEGTLPGTDMSGGRWHTSTTVDTVGEYVGQSFTATETTNVNIIGLQTANSNYTGSFTFYMCNGEEDFATCSAAPDHTQVVDYAAGTDTVRPESVTYRLIPVQLNTPFAVTKDSQYTFYMEWISGSVPFMRNTITESLYDGGQEFSSVFPTGTTTSDMVFGINGFATVGRWDDLSGNNFSLQTQFSSGGAQMPEFVGSEEDEAFNFNPVLRFDDGDDVLYRDGGIFTESDDLRDLHVYVVERPDDYDESAELYWETVNSGHVRALSTNGTGAGGSFHLQVGNDTITPTYSGSNWEEEKVMIRRDISSTTGGDEMSVSINGKIQAQEAQADDTITGVAANDLFIGASDLASGTDYDGEIAEIIFYKGDQTSTDIQRIESYLAFKYGVTLDQTSATDYIASDGTTVMWDAGDALGTFNRNIAGIGVDSRSGLEQLKSKAETDEAVITITDEDDSITNLNFLTTASDAGTGTWTGFNVPSGWQRLNRIWQVQEVGDVGTVKIEVDTENLDFDLDNLSGADSYYLLIDTDGDQSFSDEILGTGIIQMYDDATNGDETAGDLVYTRQAVDFPTLSNGGNVFYTFAQQPKSPGGVSADLVWWLDANDIDGDGISANNPADGTDLAAGAVVWKDRSPSGNNATADAGTPMYETDLGIFNGYPAVQMPDEGSHYTPATSVSYPEGITYAVYQSNDAAAGEDYLIRSTAVNNILAHNAQGTNNFGAWDGTWYTGGHASTEGEPLMVSFDTTAALNTMTVNEYKTQNGAQRVTTTFSSGGTDMVAGRLGWSMQADYAEVIVYEATKSATERIKVESYLAAKYGFTYHDATDTPTDYVASDGTLMRDVSAAGDWTNRAFIIGQDDTSGLLNTSSTTNDTDDQILAVSGASDQENLEFFSLADNNKQKTTTIEVDLGSGGRVLRLSRSWRAQHFDANGTDTLGTVDLTFDLNKQTALDATGTNTTDYVILVDTNADNDFSDASTIESSSVAAGIVTFQDVTLADGYAVTIAEPGPAIQYPFTEPLETVEFGEDEALNNGTIRTDGNIADTPMTLTIEDDTWVSTGGNAVADGADMTSGVHYNVTNGTIPAGLTLAVHKVNATTVELRLTGSATNNDNADDATFDLEFTADAFENTDVASYVLNSSKTIGINFIDPNIIDVEFDGSTANTPGTGFPAGEDAGAAAGLFPSLLVEGTIIADQTVDIVVTGGSATGAGADFIYGGASSVQTITIPAGQYDGTAGTAIDIGDPTLTQDIAIEGNETIELQIQNPSDPLVVFIDDVNTGDADAVTQDTFTFTITDDDTSGIAGVVYAADRSTPLNGRVVRLLVNGANPVSGAIYDETDAAGVFEIEPVLVNTYDKDDVLTLYLDDETENGATVVLGGTDDADILAVDIYADHVRIMDDGSTAGLVTNANIATALAGDANTSGTTSAPAGSTTDLSDLASVAGSNLDVVGGIEIATGDTYAPGGNITLEGDFINKGTYTTAAETVTFDGTGNQSLTSNGSSFNTIVNDAGADAATAAATSTLTVSDALTVANLTNQDGETIDLQANALTVTGTFANGSTAGNDAATVRLFGPQTLNITTQDVDSGTFEYYGNGDGSALNVPITDFGATDYYNLTINDPVGTNDDVFELTTGLAVANDLNVTSSELDTDTQNIDVNGDLVIATNGNLKARTSAITVGANWSNAGTFQRETSTVSFDGTGTQNILGTTNFHNFTIADTGARQIGFEESQTQTISGAFVADLSIGNAASITSVTSAEAASTTTHTLNVDVAGGGSFGTVDFVNVEYSTLQQNGATKTPALDPANSTESTASSTAGWFNNSVIISGTVFTDQGTTAYTTADTVNVLVNGVTDGTGTISAVDGTYAVTLSALPATDDIITVFIDDNGASATNDAVTVTRHDGSTQVVTGMDLYIDHVITRTETANALTSANLDTAHDGAEADLTALYADGATTTVAAGKTLLVWAGDEFAPGAVLTNNGNTDIDGTLTLTTFADDFNGNINISSTGTLTASSGSMTLAGDFTNDAAGTFTHNSGTLTFDGATQTITSAGDSFNNVVNSSSTQTNQADAFVASGTFTNSDNADWYLMGNDFTATGSFQNGVTPTNGATMYAYGTETITLTAGQDTDSGTWQFTGNGTGSTLLTTIPDFGATDYYRLRIRDVDATNSDTFQLGAALAVAGDVNFIDGAFETDGFAMDVEGDITFDTNADADFGASTVNLAGDWSQAPGATVAEGTSTVILDADDTDQTVRGGAATFYNLTIAEDDDAMSTHRVGFLQGVTHTVNGTFTAQGNAGDVIGIESVDAGGNFTSTTAFTLNNVNGNYGTVEHITVEYSTLQDGGVTKSPALNPANSSESVALTSPGWFPVPNISGTVFTDQGTTAYTTADTVNVLVNGVTDGTGTINVADGTFSVNLSATPSAADIITVFVDGGAINAATVTRHDGSVSLSGVNLYQDHLITRSEDGTALTNANLDTAHDGDADLSALWADAGTTTLTTAAGTTLLVWAGDTYAPEGTVVSTGSLDVDGTLDASAGVFVNVAGDIAFDAASTFTNTGSTIIANGTTAQSITTNGKALNDFQNANNSAAVTLPDALTVSGDMTTNANSITDITGNNVTVTGTFAHDGTIQLVGTETVTLTQDTDSGTFEYVGDGTGSALLVDIIDFGATDYYNLVINDASASNDDTFQLTAALGVANDFTVTDGTFETDNFAIDVNGSSTVDTNGVLEAGSTTFNVGTDWRTPGTFNVGTSTVILDGTGDQDVFGANNFYNLTLANTGATRTIGFQEDLTQTIAGAFNADFAAGQLGTIRTIDAAGVVLNDLSQNTINVTGSFGTVDYVDVRDAVLQESGVTKLPALDPANSTNTGNTSGWFTGPTISGTVFTDQGTTAYTTADTVNVLVNGVSDGTGAISAVNGTYSVTLSATPAAEDIITIFVDGGAINAATVTRHDNSLILSGMDLYQNHLITRTETGTALTNDDLDGAHNADADLTALYNDEATATNTLTTTSGTTLLVWTGDTYAPEDTVTSGGTLDVDGTLDASAGVTMNVAGNLVLDAAATFTNTGSIIVMNGTGAQTMTTNGKALNNLQNSNTAAKVTLTDALSVAGTLTRDTSSQLELAGNALTVTTALAGDGQVEAIGSETISVPADTAGEFEFVGDGTGSQTIHTLPALTFFNLTINDASGSNDDTFVVPGAGLDVDGTLAVTDGSLETGGNSADVEAEISLGAAGSLELGASTINLAGNWTNAGGTFNAGTSTLNLDGTSHTFAGATTFNNLAKTSAAAESITFTSGETTTVAGSLTLDGSAGQVITINASTGGVQATLNSTGTLGTIDYVDVTDHVLQESGATKSPALNPANSTDTGNTAGWFGVTVELSGATAASTDETAGDATNFATLLVLGTIGSSVTVELADLGTGSATSGGTDYTFVSPQTITIPAGSYDGTVATDIVIANPQLPVIATDVASEGPETINFTLQNPGTGVIIGDANTDTTTQTTNTYTITDDDPVLVELFSAGAVDPVTGASTDETGTADNFPTLRVLGEVTGPASVDLVDLGTGTATASGTDYLFNTPQTITIPVGSYDGTAATDIVITAPTITADTDTEGNETILLQLQNASNVTIGDADLDTVTEDDLTYTITDDDSTGLIVQFDSATYSQTEAGGNLALNVAVSNADTSGVLAETATIAFAAVTATDGGTDFDSTGLTTVTIPPADYDGSPANIVVNVPITDDNLLEGDETFTATLTAVGNENALGSVLGGQTLATATITDDETASIQFTAATSNTGGDEDGAVTVDATLTLTSTTGVPAIDAGDTITLQTAYNAASVATNGAGQDINFSSPETLSFTNADANGATKALTFTLTDDTIIETDETAIFDLTLAGAGTLNAATQVSLGANTQHILTLNDDDGLLVEFADVTANDAEASGGNLPSITVSGANTTSTGVETVQISAVSTGTAGVDYSFPTNPITIVIPAADYAVAANIAVPGLAILNDSDAESNETITFSFGTLSSNVTVGDADGGTTTESTHVYTITDDDSSVLTYGSDTFIEAAALDGSIGNTIDATLTGETFVVTSGNLTNGVHYTINNLPAALTETIAIDATGTIATITLGGTATNNANTDDVSNLEIIFNNAAFTGGSALAVGNSTKSDLVIDFGDAALAYSGAGFTETGANAGAVSGSIIVTLTGDTFAAGLTAANVTVGNTPAGLTAVLTRDSATQATLTFTGNATTHANAQDVADLTFVFTDAAFDTVTAANIAGATGPASSSLGIDFADPTGGSPFLNYASATFNEAAANNGSIGNTITATLFNDTFTTTSGSLTGGGTDYTINNLPGTLTADLAIDATGTVLTITLNGNATTHANAQDVANLEIIFEDAAFTGGSASSIVNYNKNDLIIDFDDPVTSGSIAYSALTIAEDAANDGTLDDTTITATLTPSGAETFTNASGNLALGSDYTVNNLPTGLSIGSIAVNGTGLIASITITGTAASSSNADDIANLQIAFLPSAFTNSIVPSNSSQVFSIDFTDGTGTLSYVPGTFLESGLNDGSIGNTIRAELTGDTFATTGVLTGGGTHYTMNNLPAGLTETLTVDAAGTSVIVSLSGNASVHTNTDDVSNLEIIFPDSMFTTLTALQVSNSTRSNFIIDYADAAPTNIAISATSFGDETGPVNAVFTVSLDDPAPTGGITFDLTLDDSGDADTTAGTDYTDNSGVGFTIPAGSSTYTHTVTVLDDGDNDNGNHTFTATIANVSGGLSISNATATGTIIDNDPVIVDADVDDDNVNDADENLSFDGENDINNDGIIDIYQPLVASIDDASSGLGFDYAIEVAGAGCSAIQTLTDSTEAGNATTDPNYDYTDGFLGFQVTGCNPGATATITAYFSDYTTLFPLQKYNSTNNTYYLVSDHSAVASSIQTINGISTAVYTYEVTDNDGVLDLNTTSGTILDPVGPATPAVNFNTASSSVDESAVGATTITASIASAIGSHITVNYAVSGTATAADFTDTTAGVISIPAGTTSGTATITLPADDGLQEGPETVILTMGAITNGVAGATNVHTLTINDNDLDVDLTTTSQSVAESAGTVTVTATASIANPATTAITVPYTLSGTATVGTDYNEQDGVNDGSDSITIAAGASTGTDAITITDDPNSEGSETIIVTMGTPVGAASGTPTVHVITITDNDVSSSGGGGGGSGGGSSSRADYTSLTYSGSQVRISYPYTLDTTSVPPLSDFKVKKNGVEVTISGISITGNVVTLTTGEDLGNNVIKVTYNDSDIPLLSADEEFDARSFFNKIASLGGTTGQPNCSINYTRLIKLGVRGEDVRQVQTCMNSLGYTTGVADGIYGPNTYAGITAYQRAQGLKYIDGIVGPETSASLNALGSVSVNTFELTSKALEVVSASANPTLRLDDNNTSVLVLQQRLNARGFPVSTSGPGSLGNETTYFGAKTRAAVQAFQAANGIPTTGVVGSLTWAALGGTTNQPVTTQTLAPAVAAVPTGTCSFNTNAKPGARGDHVLKIQNFLKDQGLLTATPNGFYGPATTAAVVAFQTQYPEIYTSAGLSAPTKNFYTNSRAKATELCNG